MNEELQIKIIELMDDGATLENSSELIEIVNSSEEAKSFYESILVSESAIKGFFGGDKANELNNKIDAYVDEQLTETSKILSINFKPILGFAVAARMAALAFTFFNSASQIIDSDLIVYEEPKIVLAEEAEPIFISGEDMINGLWGPSSDLANEIDQGRYEIMYTVFEGNKDNFIDNNINQPRLDREYLVDFSLVEDLDSNFIVDEVKRHIFCSC